MKNHGESQKMRRMDVNDLRKKTVNPNKERHNKFFFELL